MDAWYAAPAAVISLITTVAFIFALVLTLIERENNSDEENRLYAKRTLAVLGGYVVAWTWPVSIPLLAIIAVSFLIRAAFPFNGKDK